LFSQQLPLSCGTLASGFSAPAPARLPVLALNVDVTVHGWPQ
jgi:hypothetical protein